MAATTEITWMEQLAGSNGFNNTIIVSILSFLGVNIADVNEYIVVIVGLLTIFLGLIRLGLYIVQAIKWLRQYKKNK